MLMKIKHIMWLLDVMEGNVHEAEKYAEKAHYMKSYCPESAEWCVEMVKRHLAFNEKGMSILSRYHNELLATVDGELAGAVNMAIHEKRGWINEETAEVHVMLDKYKA